MGLLVGDSMFTNCMHFEHVHPGPHSCCNIEDPDHTRSLAGHRYTIIVICIPIGRSPYDIISDPGSCVSPSIWLIACCILMRISFRVPITVWHSLQWLSSSLQHCIGQHPGAINLSHSGHSLRCLDMCCQHN